MQTIWPGDFFSGWLFSGWQSSFYIINIVKRGGGANNLVWWNFFRVTFFRVTFSGWLFSGWLFPGDFSSGRLYFQVTFFFVPLHHPHPPPPPPQKRFSPLFGTRFVVKSASSLNLLLATDSPNLESMSNLKGRGMCLDNVLIVVRSPIYVRLTL